MRGAAGSPRRVLLVAALVLAAIPLGLALYGLGSGGSFYFNNARAPLAPADAAPYYRESLLHVGLAHLAGLTRSIDPFRLFVLAFWWLGLAALLARASRRLPPASTLLVWLVVLTHPAAMIVHAWTCHPDALLFLLTILLLVTDSPALLALLAALAAWTNLPMAVAVALSVVLARRALAAPDERTSPRHPDLTSPTSPHRSVDLTAPPSPHRAPTAATPTSPHRDPTTPSSPRLVPLALGLALGAVTCKLTLWLAGVHLARDRFAAAAAHDLPTLLHYWTAPGWPALYTLHFAHVLWFPAVVRALRPRHPRILPALVASQLLALVAAALAEDTTRVFAMIAWPVPVHALVHALASAHERDRRRLRLHVALAVLISLVAPKSFAWKGDLRTLEGAHAHLRSLLP